MCIMNHNEKNSIIVNNTLGLSKVNGSYEDFEKFSRRTLVLSSGDVNRMNLASSRARLLMDLVKNPDEASREFGSYFRGRRSDNKPHNFMTSHTAVIPIPKRVVPAYPSLVPNVRWDPSVETYAEVSQTEVKDEEKFHCRCNKCKMKRRQAHEFSEENKNCTFRDNIMSQDNYRGFAFRDNIMRFTDNSTMTSTLTDAYCEVYTPINRTTKTSEAYISTSDVDIREKVQKQTSSTYPPPILKKHDCDTCCYRTYGNQNKSHTTFLHDEAVRDISKCNEYEKLLNSVPQREFTDTRLSNRDNFIDSESCRTNLYNEGISDSIAEASIPQFLGCPMRMPPVKCPIRKDFSRFHSPIRPSVKIKSNHGRLTNKCVGEKEPGIPYAHREHSRYHYDCKEPGKKVNFRYDDDCGRHGLVVSSRIPSHSQVSKVLLCDRLSSKLPKKLLSSERDIDSYIGSKRMNTRF